MTRKIKPDSIVYTDSWQGYQVLDVSGFRHWRINHAKRFAEAHNHINGIENFGVRQSVIYTVLTAFPERISGCF